MATSDGRNGRNRKLKFHMLNQKCKIECKMKVTRGFILSKPTPVTMSYIINFLIQYQLETGCSCIKACGEHFSFKPSHSTPCLQQFFGNILVQNTFNPTSKVTVVFYCPNAILKIHSIIWYFWDSRKSLNCKSCKIKCKLQNCNI